MPLNEEIQNQQDLLHIHRKHLAILLKQYALHGAGFVPPIIPLGIDESRTSIARIKFNLREWGQVVDDHPDDAMNDWKVFPHMNTLPVRPDPFVACPFSPGPSVPATKFYGRRDQRYRIRMLLGGEVPSCIALVGIRRSGKSSLLRYLVERRNEFCPNQAVIMVSLSLQDTRYHTPIGIYEGVRREVEHAIGRSPWSQSDNNNPWAIAAGLEYLRVHNYHLIILIDEFEWIATRLEAFNDWGDDWRSKATMGLLTLILTSTRPINDIYTHCGLTSPFGNIFTTLVVGAFEPTEWHLLVHEGFARRSINPSEADLALIDEMSGGIPYYVQLAAMLLWQYEDHDRVRREFYFQAQPFFRSLWGDLNKVEQATLWHAMGKVNTAKPSTGAYLALERYGLLRPDGRPFSGIFEQIIKEMV